MEFTVRILRMLVIGPAFFILAGCSGSTIDVATQLSLDSISGDWAGACQVDDGVAYSSSLLTITSDSMTVTTSMYGDNDTSCATLDAEISVQITGIEVEGESDSVDGAYNFKGTVSNLTLTPKDAAVATAFNSITLCGYSDWALDTAKDIFNCSALDADFSSGDTIYDMYYADTDSDPNTFQMGNSSALFSTTEESRPTELMTYTYTK